MSYVRSELIKISSFRSQDIPTLLRHSSIIRSATVPEKDIWRKEMRTMSNATYAAFLTVFVGLVVFGPASYAAFMIT